MPRKPFFLVLLPLLATMSATGAYAHATFPDDADTSASTVGHAAYMPHRVLVQFKPAGGGRARLKSRVRR